jgi:ketosteroid isomerase-like protein
MSQQNIDLAERLHAAINAGELPEELLSPDCRIEDVKTAVTENTWYGMAGMRQWMSNVFEAFEEGARYETEEIVADGEDFVVARVHLVGRGARSGAPILLRSVNVAWIHDGKITRVAGYMSRREALEAVGPVT